MIDGYNYIGMAKIAGAVPRRLRDLVAQTSGTIAWDGKNSTAIVKIDKKEQKYKVDEGKVYIGIDKVGDIENDFIMVMESDFNKDFNIVGNLTIYSYWKDGEEIAISPNNQVRTDWVSGHGFIHYKSDDSVFDTFYSTWLWRLDEYGGKVDDPRIYYNRQEDIALFKDANTASHGRRITRNQQTQMANEILKSKNDTWTKTNNCATFASRVFEAATEIRIIYATPLTPKVLKYGIEFINKHGIPVPQH